MWAFYSKSTSYAISAVIVVFSITPLLCGRMCVENA